MFNYEHLYDENFLIQLTEYREKVTYIRIIALDSQNNPISEVEGRVTQGSINIDGNSAIRRSCSLTFVTDKYDYSNYIWGLQTKFKLEIGLKNNVNSNYDNIIWFPQGVYITTSFNLSRNAENFTVSLSAKDKMCLLNGDVSGHIEATTDFGKLEEEDSTGQWITTQLKIPDIIMNVVSVYGDEPRHNIIINDLQDYGLELLEYRGDNSMYLWKVKDATKFGGTFIGDKASFTVIDSKGNTKLSYRNVAKIDDEYFSTLYKENLIGDERYYFHQNGNYFDVVKISYGQAAGYRKTDLTYAGELIAKAGETVVSVLDKIKKMLGEYEYFYDVNGMFVFQQKKSSLKNIWSIADLDENNNEVINEALGNNNISYVFNNGLLLTSFNNNTKINDIKNDFSIWGERKGVLGAKIPIHFRYAIDKKPKRYTTISISEDEVDAYNKKNNTKLKYTKAMTDAEWASAKGKSKYKRIKTYIYDSNQRTYSEPNLIDSRDTNKIVICDWREILYQMADDYLKYNHVIPDFFSRVKASNPELFMGYTGYEQYYTDIQGFWRQIFFPPPDYDPNNEYEANDYFQNGQYKYWNKSVLYSPETLNFWFDFLDTDGYLNQFSVKNIGDRMKVVNDTKINGIFFNTTPNIVYESQGDTEGDLAGYDYFQLGSMEDLFSISTTKNSAKDKVDSLINEHCVGAESATINCVPLYFLQPNTIIEINDDDTNLHGKYEITKISLPLTYNGTMSLTAQKVIDNII